MSVALNEIPAKHNFVCLSLGNISGAPRGRAPRRLEESGAIVHFRAPFQTDAFWTKALGTFGIGKLQETRLAITASAPLESSITPQELENRAYFALRGILLQGHPSAAPIIGLQVFGRTDVAPPKIATSYMAPRGKHPWEGILRIDDSSLSTADRLAAEGMRIFGAADPAYSRLKRGLDAWDKATMEGRADARLHDLVRSLEALMSTKSGKTRKQFVQRGQLFVKAPKASLVLGQMYDMRSAYEHGNDWRSAIRQNSAKLSEDELKP